MSMVRLGEKLPGLSTTVHVGFAGTQPDAPRTVESLVGTGKTLLVTLPGAFTPT